MFRTLDLGATGVPVAGSEDIDGDGYGDLAIAHYLSSPQGRLLAGEVHLILGDGRLSAAIDLAVPQPGFLSILGSGRLGA